MKIFSGLIFLILPLLQSCSEPKGNIYEDTRLAQEAEVKFCLMGDMGRDTEHQQVMADALEREDCHRIFFLGDLVYPEGIKSADDPELVKRFMNYYEPMLVRNPDLIINLILGNHDHKLEPAAWKDVSNRHPRFFFPNYYYVIDYGGLCMVAMDTSFYYYPKKVMDASEQTAWLMNLQSRLKKCDVKVALTHHPMKGDSFSGSKDWNGSSGPLRAFLETWVIGKFDMHIAGHVHILADDGKDEGTRMLISGTGGENLGDGKAGFVVLRWQPANPKRLGYSFRYIDTTVNVFEEDSQTIQKEEKHDPSHLFINRNWVELPWWVRILNFFGINI